MRTTYTAWVIALLAACLCVNPNGAAGQEVKSKGQQVQEAIEKAKKYLQGAHDQEKHWGDDTPVVVLALLEAREYWQPRETGAVDELAKPTDSPSPWRVAALAELAANDRDKYRAALFSAASNLLTKRGTTLRDKTTVLGEAEAAAAHAIFQTEMIARYETPKGYWKLADARWREAQRADGSWEGKGRQGSDEAATAAGMAVLSMASGMLEAEQWTPAKGNYDDKAVDKAAEWLGGRLPRARLTPRQWCAVEDAALVTGRRTFGQFDWWPAGRDSLLATQRKNGSWGDSPRETAWAAMFLARGRIPIILNKLRYDGLWNTGPWDAANFGRWLGPQLCYPPLQWQDIDVKTDPAMWHDAPILYVSMAAPPKFSDADLARLGAFVEQGGLILTENATEDPAIDQAVRQLAARIFSGRRMVPLPANHPVFSIHHQINGVPIEGLSNGVRLMILHSPKPFSFALHRRMWVTQVRPYRMMFNLFFYTSWTTLRECRRGIRYWPQHDAFIPVATVRVARVKHAGEFDPEPLAWERFAILMGNRHKAKVEVSEPMAAGELDAKKWPIAAVTCTGEKPLTEADLPALRAYVAAGGTLVADIAGGADPATAAAVHKLLNGIEPGQPLARLPANHAMYARPDAPIAKVQFTRALRGEIGRDKAPRLEGLSLNGRLAVIFSPDDLTAALAGVQVYVIRGYQPESAFELMRNVLLHAAGVKLEAKPDAKP